MEVTGRGRQGVDDRERDTVGESETGYGDREWETRRAKAET